MKYHQTERVQQTLEDRKAPVGMADPPNVCMVVVLHIQMTGQIRRGVRAVRDRQRGQKDAGRLVESLVRRERLLHVLQRGKG